MNDRPRPPNPKASDYEAWGAHQAALVGHLLPDVLSAIPVPPPPPTPADPPADPDPAKEIVAVEPVIVPAETNGKPIFPVVQVVGEHPAREAGRLAYAVRDDLSVGGQLPVFATGTGGPRVPILELADRRGGPIRTRGRGAPLDLRLFVGGCALVPHLARSARGRLVVTVRELRDFLFPNGWERRRDWKRIREALYRAHNYVIPHPDGGVCLPFRLWREPGPGARLNEVVMLDIELPTGSSNGPPVDRRQLALAGVRSSPRFRSLIAANSITWRPGVSRVWSPRHGRWLWSRDPASYPVLTRADRRRLASGEADTKPRTRSQIDDAWEDLTGFKIAARNAVDGRRCQG